MCIVLPTLFLPRRRVLSVILCITALRRKDPLSPQDPHPRKMSSSRQFHPGQNAINFVYDFFSMPNWRAIFINACMFLGCILSLRASLVLSLAWTACKCGSWNTNVQLTSCKVLVKFHLWTQIQISLPLHSEVWHTMYEALILCCALGFDGWWWHYGYPTSVFTASYMLRLISYRI